MNSIQRFNAVINQDPTDKIPVMVGNYNIFLTNYYNISISQYLNDTDLHSEFFIDMVKKFEFDVIYPGRGYIFYGCGSETGIEWIFPSDGFPACVQGIVNSIEDLSKIEIPSGPSGYFAKFIEINRQAKIALGSQTYLGIDILGPFSVATFFRGYENLLIDMINNRHLFDKLMEKAVDFSLYLANECLKLEFLRCELNEIFIVPEAISANNYHNLILPYINRVCRVTIPPLIHSELIYFGKPGAYHNQIEARKISDYLWGSRESVDVIRESAGYEIPGYPKLVSITSNALSRWNWNEIKTFLSESIDIFLLERNEMPCIYLTSIQAESHEQAIEVAEKLFKINEFSNSYFI